MISLNSEAGSHIIEAIVHEKITKDDMDNIDELLEQKAMTEAPINLLLVMEDMKGITPKALLEDIKMVKYLKIIHKAAIVADKTWLKLDAKTENLLPGIDVKPFETTQITDAIDWLQE